MLSPRIRRLNLDYEMLLRRFANWPLIVMSGSAGMPPEVYCFTYCIKGLYVSPNGEILERDSHLLEINLSLGYPRRAPQCRMMTPVFHPNFDESSVCIGDFWTGAWLLASAGTGGAASAERGAMLRDSMGRRAPF